MDRKPMGASASLKSINIAEEFQDRCKVSEINNKLVCIGGGSMGGALIKGFLRSGMLDSRNITVTAKHESTLEKYREKNHFCMTSLDNATALSMAENGIVILAVKPYALDSVVAKCKQQLLKMNIIISVLAGVTIEKIAKSIGIDFNTANTPVIVRAMPNTPALIGSGATTFVASRNCTESQAKIVNLIFTTVGLSIEVTHESQIDAVCGLSGSGPAYVFTIIDALSDGGVKMGLDREVATKLAAQTLLGAAKMVLKTEEHPAVLKSAVCSPGGTTISGLHVLEAHGIRNACISAVEAATNRAAELGQTAGSSVTKK